jgi:hypothetical protein
MELDKRPFGTQLTRGVGPDDRIGPTVELEEDKPGFSLSLPQVLASSLAAASAAVVASFFGVAGTVAGTALFSVVATVSTAVYQHAAQRTADRLAHVGPLLRRPDRSGVAAPSLPWRPIAGITTFELTAGRPVSALLGRNDDSGTSIARVIEPGRSPRSAAPTPTRRSDRSREVTPSPSTTAPGYASPNPAPGGSPGSAPTGSAPTDTPKRMAPTQSAPASTAPPSSVRSARTSPTVPTLPQVATAPAVP